MANPGRYLGIVLLGMGCLSSSAREYEGSRGNSILLNGTWEFSLGDGIESVESIARERGDPWKQVNLPGPFMTYKAWSENQANRTKFVWARRDFTATRNQADGLAVLRWNRIACGAEAFINGRKVGENEPTGPYQVLVPAGVLKAGKNEIVLKVRGAAGVRRSQSGNALIPAGFGVEMPEVTDDVWIDFADAAYMKWVLALPNLGASRVRIRVAPTGVERLDDLTIVAEVKPWPTGATIGKGQAAARLVPDSDPLGGEHFFVDVPMPGYQPWTHEKCPLYIAKVKLVKAERLLDEVTFRFGMREIGVKDRHYRLDAHAPGCAGPWNREGKSRLERRLRRPALGRLAQHAVPGPCEP